MIETNQLILKEWAKEHKMPAANDSVFIGQRLNNEIKAVVEFCGFFGKSCMIHVSASGSHWITREFLHTVFDYPFVKLKLKVIIGTVASSNVKALKLNRHLGFKDVATIPDAHADGDLVILEMRPTDCRYLGE